MSNNYDKGRLNLPFVGICTFGKYPYVENWDNPDKTNVMSQNYIEQKILDHCSYIIKALLST